MKVKCFINLFTLFNTPPPPRHNQVTYKPLSTLPSCPSISEFGVLRSIANTLAAGSPTLAFGHELKHDLCEQNIVLWELAPLLIQASSRVLLCVTALCYCVASEAKEIFPDTGLKWRTKGEWRRGLFGCYTL